MPGPLQAGARGSPHRPARPRPAAPSSRRPLTELGAPGGGRNKEPQFFPRTVGASSHNREGSAPSRTRPARVLPAPPGHGELRAAAAALGLLRGGRRWVVTLLGPHPLSLALSVPYLGTRGCRGVRAGSAKLSSGG